MEISETIEKRIALLAGQGPVCLLEIRGQNQRSMQIADKKNPGQKREMHFLEVSAEVAGSGRHVQVDYFGPRDQQGPVEMIAAPKGSIILAELSGWRTENGATRARIAQFEVVHKAASFAAPLPAVQPPAAPAVAARKSA